MGDPAGIGPEITCGAWRALHAEGPAFFVIADPALFADAGVPIRAIAEPEEALSCFPDALPILPLALAAPARPGKPDPANAPSVIAAIERAVALTRAGRAAANCGIDNGVILPKCIADIAFQQQVVVG